MAKYKKTGEIPELALKNREEVKKCKFQDGHLVFLWVFWWFQSFSSDGFRGLNRLEIDKYMVLS